VNKKTDCNVEITGQTLLQFWFHNLPLRPVHISQTGGGTGSTQIRQFF